MNQSKITLWGAPRTLIYVNGITNKDIEAVEKLLSKTAQERQDAGVLIDFDPSDIFPLWDSEKIYLGIGVGFGSDRADNAAKTAINELEGQFKKASFVYCLVVSKEINLEEVEVSAKKVNDVVCENAAMFFAAVESEIYEEGLATIVLAPADNDC